MTEDKFDKWADLGSQPNGKGVGKDAQLKFAGVLPGASEAHLKAKNSGPRLNRENDDYDLGG